MFRFITPPDAAIFTGILGIVMVLTGREIGGAIVIAASLGAFIYFEWFLYHRQPAPEPGAEPEEVEDYPEDYPLPYFETEEEREIAAASRRTGNSR